MLSWQFTQGQRRLLPTSNEAAMARAIRNHFSRFRSFEGWWEDAKAAYAPEFVEFVEEQRSKAA